MNELAVYIINYYGNLMTAEENAAHQSILAEYKIERANSPSMTETMQPLVSTDPKVRALLANGREAFFAGVRDRVLRDHPNEVFLNNCPRCGALAKTPTAKQCRKCFFSWHGDVLTRR
jgi:hypothetical protein